MKKDLSRRKFLQRTIAGTAGALAAANTFFCETSAWKPPAIPASRPATAYASASSASACKGPVCSPPPWRFLAREAYCGRRSVRRYGTLAREIVGNPNLFVTRRYKDLLDNKEIDCLIAAVPDHWHKQVVVDAVHARQKLTFIAKNPCRIRLPTAWKW